MSRGWREYIYMVADKVVPITPSAIFDAVRDGRGWTVAVVSDRQATLENVARGVVEGYKGVPLVVRSKQEIRFPDGPTILFINSSGVSGLRGYHFNLAIIV